MRRPGGGRGRGQMLSRPAILQTHADARDLSKHRNRRSTQPSSPRRAPTTTAISAVSRCRPPADRSAMRLPTLNSRNESSRSQATRPLSLVSRRDFAGARRYRRCGADHLGRVVHSVRHNHDYRRSSWLRDRVSRIAHHRGRRLAARRFFISDRRWRNIARRSEIRPEAMQSAKIVVSLTSGCITGQVVGMFELGLFRSLLDAQCFDLRAMQS